MKSNLQQWSKLSLAFAVGVSLSAGYVALGMRQLDEPQVVVVEERCPEPEDATTQPPPPQGADPLGLTRDPPYYGMSQAELEQMARECDLRDDRPAPMSDEIAAALGLYEAEREAWEKARAKLDGRDAAIRRTLLAELAPELDVDSLGPIEQELKISKLARETKRPEDAALHRHMAQERAGLRQPPDSPWDAEASAWARWERHRLSHGNRFADELSEELGRVRVDELRSEFKGWPGGGTRHWDCEAPPDPSDPVDVWDRVELSSGLDRTVVVRVVRAHLGEIQSCYQRGLADDPKLRGTVVVEFTIDTGGGVGRMGKVSIGEHSDLDHEATEQCILEAVDGWSFPRPRNGALVKVSYPFFLKPS